MIDRQTQITVCCELSDAIKSGDMNRVKQQLKKIQQLKPYPYKRFGFLEQIKQ